MEKILTDENGILTEDRIAEQMTRLKPYRDVQPNATIKVAFFTEAPNYHTGSLSEYWTAYYPDISQTDNPSGSNSYKEIKSEYDDAVKCLNGFKAISDSATQQKLFDQAIAAWARMSNVTIVKVTDPATADVRIGLTSGSNNINIAPGSSTTNPLLGDIFLNPGLIGIAQYLNSDAAISNLMHEFGHALGLSHPSQRDGDGALPWEYGSQRYSVMSYESIKETGYATAGFLPVTPMLFDALGLEKMGLLKTNQNTEDKSVYSFAKYSSTKLPSGRLIIDSQGSQDTIDASQTDTANEIDLRATDFSAGKAYFSSIGTAPGKYNVAIYKGSVIENAIGGTKNDVIIGNDIANKLTGGLGNDLLLGGKDADTYLINAGDGNDTIIDSDGQGHIEWAGLTLQGSPGLPPGQWRKLGNSSWQDQTNHLYYSLLPQSDGSNTLTITRNGSGERLQIKQWTAGQLGITLGAGTEAALPTTPSTIYGDRAPIDFDPAAPGVQTQTDNLGNLKTDPNRIEANRADTLYDSAANDLIIAGGGDDHLYLIRGGNNIAQGGDGADIIDTTGSGNNQLEGNAGADLIAGDQGKDILYGGDKIDFDLAASQGESAATLAEQGDLLDGKGGSDTLIGTATSDLLTGGAGEDILLGGGGDDTIYGDGEITLAYRDWSTQRTTNQLTDHTEYQVTFSRATFSDNPDTAGVDVIYGGAGDDWIFAGGGNDIVLGGKGADVIFGQDGNNLIDGGEGNDILSGGTGDDFIVGGEGNDKLQGSDYLHRTETGNDTLDGGVGNDTLSGMAGDDTLIGGRGDDGLFGGSGNDTYQIGATDGSDGIIDESGDDTLELAVARSAVTLTRSGSNISLNWGSVTIDQGYAQYQYSLTIEKGTAGAINRFRFADRSLSATELLKSLDPLSHANITGDANSPSMGAGDELATLSNTSTTAVRNDDRNETLRSTGKIGQKFALSVSNGLEHQGSANQATWKDVA